MSEHANGQVQAPPQIASECISVVLSEIPMNYEFQAVVLDRAKALVGRRSDGVGEGARLQNGNHEIAARLVAGICRYYMHVMECQQKMDEVFHEAQRIREELIQVGCVADYMEWLDVASASRGKK